MLGAVWLSKETVTAGGHIEQLLFVVVAEVFWECLCYGEKEKTKLLTWDRSVWIEVSWCGLTCAFPIAIHNILIPRMGWKWHYGIKKNCIHFAMQSYFKINKMNNLHLCVCVRARMYVCVCVCVYVCVCACTVCLHNVHVVCWASQQVTKSKCHSVHKTSRELLNDD